MSLVSKVSTACSWRLDLLRGKTAGQLTAVPWPLLMKEVLVRRELAWETPPFTILEQDEAAGLVLMDVGGVHYWMIREADPVVMQGVYKETYCSEHPHHFEHGDCRIRTGDVVIDAGACEGFFIRYALERGARVLAVEPSSRMADALRRTFAPEIAAGRVVIEQALISDRCGESTLVMNPKWPTGASEWAAAEEGFISETVPCTTIDTLVQSSPWGRCDFLKMDIEGSERGAIAGSSTTLRNCRPNLSIAVYHRPTGYMDIAADLRGANLGYRVTGKGLVLGLDQIWRPLMLHATVAPEARPKPSPER